MAINAGERSLLPATATQAGSPWRLALYWATSAGWQRWQVPEVGEATTYVPSCSTAPGAEAFTSWQSRQVTLAPAMVLCPNCCTIPGLEFRWQVTQESLLLAKASG